MRRLIQSRRSYCGMLFTEWTNDSEDSKSEALLERVLAQHKQDQSRLDELNGSISYYSAEIIRRLDAIAQLNLSIDQVMDELYEDSDDIGDELSRLNSTTQSLYKSEMDKIDHDEQTQRKKLVVSMY